MADGKAEISDVNNINVPHVVIIQALVRGNLVRWRLEKLRRAYEQVFSEIERHDSHHVEWKHDSPCFPKIEKGTPTQRAFHKNINNDKQKKSPRMSSQSPVSHMSRSGRLDHISTAASRREKPVQSVIDSTSLTNVTSVWDSYNSIPDMPDVPLSLPDDKEELQQMRKNIAMELLWVQQAIDSRKNYLKLKGSM
ncbi:IQCC-like protein [Mya arenaria]|uniref:IQCC-like protein n=1 Tax=Mya arenaria TaxID=6604 RepID=A0ABY7F964_MYAAR|nr:IQCC-like protein [Mya arenaria]